MPELEPRRVTARDLRFLQERAARDRIANPDDTLALVAEVHRLRKVVREYENSITWGISCNACATALDASYAETVRAEQAEHKLMALGAIPGSPLAVFVTDAACVPPPVVVSWDETGEPTVSPYLPE